MYIVQIPSALCTCMYSVCMSTCIKFCICVFGVFSFPSIVNFLVPHQLMQEAEQPLEEGVYVTFSKLTSVDQVMDRPMHSDIFQSKVKQVIKTFQRNEQLFTYLG